MAISRRGEMMSRPQLQGREYDHGLVTLHVAHYPDGLRAAEFAPPLPQCASRCAPSEHSAQSTGPYCTVLYCTVLYCSCRAKEIKNAPAAQAPVKVNYKYLFEKATAECEALKRRCQALELQGAEAPPPGSPHAFSAGNWHRPSLSLRFLLRYFPYGPWVVLLYSPSTTFFIC